MAIKSAYRKPKAEAPAKEIPEPNIPEIKIEGAEPKSLAAVSIDSDPGEESPEVAAAIKTASEADTAATALKHQIEALRQSEELQRRQQMAMAAQRPPTRDEKLAYWRSIGTDENELRFLEANPELIDLPELTSYAAAEAQNQGHKRGTEAHMTTTKEIFDKHLTHLRAQAEAAQPTTPEFFQPPPAPEPAGPASYVSAPVSRGAIGSYREPLPSQVKLSPDELQIAAASGISPTEYARHKLRLEREKRTGQRQ